MDTENLNELNLKEADSTNPNRMTVPLVTSNSLHLGRVLTPELPNPKTNSMGLFYPHHDLLEDSTQCCLDSLSTHCVIL